MKAQTQRSLRNLHNWFGVFFAPGILFFSFTGVLQTLGLHEADDGVRPPAWIAAIASLHKHQVVSHGPRRPSPPRPAVAEPPHEAGHDDHDHDAPLSPLKLYVVLLSAVLFASTLVGVVIALTNRAARRRTGALLAAGTLVPVLLLLV